VVPLPSSMESFSPSLKIDLTFCVGVVGYD